jgi:hypothetical protein
MKAPHPYTIKQHLNGEVEKFTESLLKRRDSLQIETSAIYSAFDITCLWAAGELKVGVMDGHDSSNGGQD